jgi:hypothetical protein
MKANGLAPSAGQSKVLGVAQQRKYLVEVTYAPEITLHPSESVELEIEASSISEAFNKARDKVAPQGHRDRRLLPNQRD